MRSYGQYCSVARSLDIVGDRWTLLIVRELTIQGPCRYTELRQGLPGIATNLLADRLRELEQAGIVKREEAPPPVATVLFSLTPRGEELKPVLDALHGWGMSLMTELGPQDVVRSSWLAATLQTLLVDRRPEEPLATIAVTIGDQPILIESGNGAVRAATGESTAEPDMTITGPTVPVMGLLLGGLPLPAARAAGVEVEGDPSVLERLVPPAADRPPAPVH